MREMLCGLLLGALLAGATLSAGCRQANPVAELSIPREGDVRVLARSLDSSDRHVHWKWSVIGERNWRIATADSGGLHLQSTYPLNDAVERGGCNIWECDIEASRPAANGTTVVTETLHGSDGTTARWSTSPASAAADLRDVVSRVQDRDIDVRLPADLPLATIAGRPVHLTVTS